MASADARGRGSAANCRSSLREGKDLPSGAGDAAWTRQVGVTFAGPRFFAIHIQDSYFCGGAYPSAEDQALVFDLSTGRPVSWTPLFPAALRAPTVTASAGDGATLGFFKVTPALAELIGPDEECRDDLEDRYIMIWPDRAAGALMLGLRGFPHAIQACESDTALKPAQLQRLGFSKALIDALSHPDL